MVGAERIPAGTTCRPEVGSGRSGDAILQILRPRLLRCQSINNCRGNVTPPECLFQPLGELVLAYSAKLRRQLRPGSWIDASPDQAGPAHVRQHSNYLFQGRIEIAGRHQLCRETLKTKRKYFRGFRRRERQVIRPFFRETGPILLSFKDAAAEANRPFQEIVTLLKF